jgi:hypothetical protein
VSAPIVPVQPARTSTNRAVKKSKSAKVVPIGGGAPAATGTPSRTLTRDPTIDAQTNTQRGATASSGTPSHSQMSVPAEPERVVTTGPSARSWLMPTADHVVVTALEEDSAVHMPSPPEVVDAPEIDTTDFSVTSQSAVGTQTGSSIATGAVYALPSSDQALRGTHDKDSSTKRKKRKATVMPLEVALSQQNAATTVSRGSTHPSAVRSICGSCKEAVVDVVLDACDHSLCSTCAWTTSRCPICGVPVTGRRSVR